MRKSMRILASVTVAGLLTSTATASAQSTEEKFQDLFITAGYCTAFGAAIGVALLGLTPDSASENLKYVAMGASLGFIGGSALGTYIIFAPGLADNASPTGGTLASSQSLPSKGVVVRPVYNLDTHKIAAVESGMTLLSF